MGKRRVKLVPVNVNWFQAASHFVAMASCKWNKKNVTNRALTKIAHMVRPIVGYAESAVGWYLAFLRSVEMARSIRRQVKNAMVAVLSPHVYMVSPLAMFVDWTVSGWRVRLVIVAMVSCKQTLRVAMMATW
jgi:hypothetical protein